MTAFELDPRPRRTTSRGRRTSTTARDAAHEAWLRDAVAAVRPAARGGEVGGAELALLGILGCGLPADAAPERRTGAALPAVAVAILTGIAAAGMILIGLANAG